MTRRFFFHFTDGHSVSHDEVGVECADAEQAYLEAVAAAHEMWPGLMAERIDPLACAFDVVNERGEMLYRIAFIELLEACRGGRADKPAVLHEMYAKTHRRAQAAKEDVRRGLAEVRRTLDESVGLISKLDRMRRSSSKQR